MAFYMNIHPLVGNNIPTIHIKNKNDLQKQCGYWLKENEDDYLADIIEHTYMASNNGGLKLGDGRIVPLYNGTLVLPWDSSQTTQYRYETDVFCVRKGSKALYPYSAYMWFYLSFSYSSNTPTAGVTNNLYTLNIIRSEGRLKYDLDIYINDLKFYTLPKGNYSYANTASGLKTYTIANSSSVAVYLKLNGYQSETYTLRFNQPPLIARL